MPECSFCGRRAVYHERTAGVYRCDRCFLESIEKRFRRTVSKEDLVAPGDKVVVGVSGGPDSVSCLYLLSEYSKHRDLEVTSLTIDEGIGGYRSESIPIVRRNSEELGLEHVTVTFEEAFGKSLDELSELSEDKNGPETCTLCGVLRRSVLNQAAREMGADKLAIAHNLDDMVQTIFLNYLRGDMSRLARVGPKNEGQEGFVPRIKPLMEISEKEVGIYAMLRGFEFHLGDCPYIGGMRSEVRNFLNKMEYRHPTTKFRILRMFEKLKSHLPDSPDEFELGECENCGEPATGELCRACELLKKMGVERDKKSLISDEQ